MRRRKLNVRDGRLFATPPETNIQEFKGELKESHLYLVEVSFMVGNPIHLSVLCTGFKNGGYWELWNNTGENRRLVSLITWPRYIKVIRPLGSINDRELDVKS